MPQVKKASNGIIDNNRFGQDHVKGTFGALTFLRRIIKSYYYATEDTLRKLRVLFVHARGNPPFYLKKNITPILNNLYFENIIRN